MSKESNILRINYKKRNVNPAYYCYLTNKFDDDDHDERITDIHRMFNFYPNFLKKLEENGEIDDVTEVLHTLLHDIKCKQLAKEIKNCNNMDRKIALYLSYKTIWTNYSETIRHDVETDSNSDWSDDDIIPIFELVPHYPCQSLPGCWD